MSKIAIAAIILLCFATATGCWFTYAVEYRRQGRETREIEAREQAALESEMYQAWHYAMRYEAFGDPLGRSKNWPKNIKTYDRRDLWVKLFQRSDVKLAGKSQKFGNASYQVSSTIGIQDRVSDSTFEEVWRHAPISVVEAAMQHEVWHHLSVRCNVEKMDGPGDWIASDWNFSSIAYRVLPPSLESRRPSHNGDFPFQLVKSIGVP